jgi:AcrR family transcriptional regulator
MPKIIDHENQKKMIAEAALRIIHSNGMANVTVRNVATEAGLSLGAMRYYFPKQEHLFIFCMNFVRDKTAERFRNLSYPPSDPPLDHVKKILFQMLPLDDERKLYLTVWLSFLSESLNMPELQPLCRHMYEDLHEIIRKSVQLLFDFGIVRPDIDFPFEVERLYALVDGLCLHCLTDSAEETLSAADSVLTRHLEKLCIILNGKIDYPVHNLKQ